MAKDKPSVQLQFIGAAGTVTGSKTLVQTAKRKLLIDCGLFQGNKSERKLNKLRMLPFKPSELDAIILTHGHLDHCGYLPVMVKKGFSGPIYATTPTRDITEVILQDSARIQEEDAREANKRRSESKKPLKPLYREEHVNRTITLFQTHPANEWVQVDDDLRFRFQKSGHILGSAMVELEVEGHRFVFSGDVGQRVPLILDAPTSIDETDYLILESTYGDKLHDDTVSPYQALEEVVNRTFEKGGTLVIPSFAVERAQEIILILNNLMDEKSIPSIPIYLDSPMGADVTRIFQQHRDWHNLSEDECDSLTKNVNIVQSFEETLNVLDEDGPKNKIIIAGSGMITGGRVLYYLKQLVGDSKNTVLLVGHQAFGTRGHQLSNGAHEIKIDEEKFQVHAEISQIGSLSAHADQGDLLWWLGHFKETPKHIFLNHGEKEATEALKKKVEGTYDCAVTATELNKVYEL
ncbi:MBL fold metallo-hydrolase [Pontibacter diazotrophicus]|uniref:MBL fold metallo-hydrolase n=1 Tax=Pontibacter diazotrophicus TaxID=1400979 RepID=A0A3D8L996_9BACT|nr:MBL fold metallo-hydrolase [Pontibacter diazotrophicus]RDV13980.1 MBL fold metallo-hydrolase [Pontibacter diazotrophicus]